MIEIINLAKSYGSQTVLNGISLEMDKGQSIALIGPNGSGKTTLIKSIMGLVIPDTGEIKVLGKPIKSDYEYRANIGYMPQINRFPEHMKVYQLFTMLKKMRPSVNGYDTELYEKFEIEKMRNKQLGSLSGGMRQKVSAATAFLFNPSIIILDEPTAGLDPLSNDQLKEKINQSASDGKLVITTSHILNDLDDIASHVVYLMEGKIRFFKGMDTLKNETNEVRLNKMIVKILKEEIADA